MMKLFNKHTQETTVPASHFRDSDTCYVTIRPETPPKKINKLIFLQIMQESDAIKWLLKRPDCFLTAYIMSVSIRLLACYFKRSDQSTCMRDNFLSFSGTLAGPVALMGYMMLQTLWQLQSHESLKISTGKHCLFVTGAVLLTMASMNIAIESSLHLDLSNQNFLPQSTAPNL